MWHWFRMFSVFCWTLLISLYTCMYSCQYTVRILWYGVISYSLFFVIFRKNPFLYLMIAIYIPRQSKFIPFFDLYGVFWLSNLVVDKRNRIFRVWCIKMLSIISALQFIILSRMLYLKLIWWNFDYSKVWYVQAIFIQHYKIYSFMYTV